MAKLHVAAVSRKKTIRNQNFTKSFLIVLIFLLAPELMAQNGSNEPATRTEQIQAERADKAVNSRPGDSSTVEKYFGRIEDVLIGSPIRIGVEGRGPGGGLTVGSVFNWSSYGDRVRSKLWGNITINRFYEVGTGVELPHVGGHDLSFALEAWHQDAPQLEYFGSGNDSSVNNRTDYRREDTVLEFRVRFSPHRRVTSSCALQQVWLNVGPGTNGNLPSTEQVFGPLEAPGIDVQSNYLIGGCAAQFDGTEYYNDPHTGTYAAAGYDRYHAEEHDRFSFNRFDAAVEHYIPFFNDKRVIALFGRTVLSWHSRDQVVPFYLQTTLGSDRTLRGFRRYRFYGENSILFNAEYRWQVNTGFDMALFGDSGRVFNKPGEISLSNPQTSAGFGLRFKGQKGVAVRFDIGFSREGGQIWLRFGNLY